MFLKNSRYSKARGFEPLEENGTFQGVRARAVNTLEGVIEHTVTENDRLDHLAQHYYSNNRLWWKILDANPNIRNADVLLGEDYVGKVILIPKIKE